MRIAAAVLAAGLGSRMGSPKPIVQARGKPLAGWILESLLENPFDSVLLVTGHAAEQVERELSRYPVRIIRNSQFKSGMSSSIRMAVESVAHQADALLIVPADMPMIGPGLVKSLIGAASPDRIVVPVHEGRPGHPVLFGKDFFPELSSLQGDQGARSVITAHRDAVAEIPVEDSGVLVDIDTQTDLANWQAEQIS